MPVVSVSRPLDAHQLESSARDPKRALVVALVGFLKPVIDACIMPREMTGEARVKNTAPPNDVLDNEGEQLLTALEKFVVATITSQSSERADKTTQNKKESVFKEKSVPIGAVTLVSRPSQRWNLPPEVSEEARRIVFNQMPIRVLSFDETGSQMVLLERSKVLERILRQVFIRTSSNNFLETPAQLKEMVNTTAQYAILSHTWIRDDGSDVVFQDWKDRELNRRGYTKIAKFCQVAATKHNVTFGWMDTVCINKDSSSELDESIRSMYRWYRNSYVCVAYLSETQDLEHIHLDSWFTRGWTLQELLAPCRTYFYNKNWAIFGAATLHYVDETILRDAIQSSDIDIKAWTALIWNQIEKATTITSTEFQLFENLRDPNARPGADGLFSRIMQLASRRTVTREEDKVYSIMGLLNVEISIAYGEGSKRALLRLLRECLAMIPNVLDIFNHGFSKPPQLLTADINDYLTRSETITAQSEIRKWKSKEPLIYTHLGVRISLLLFPAVVKGEKHQYTPQGGVSGSAVVETTRGSTSYDLLDRFIYPKINSFVGLGRISDTHVVFGVINFNTDNNNIVIYQHSLAIPLSLTVWNERMGLLYSRAIIPVIRPVICTLQRSDIPGLQTFLIPKTELEKHGIRLITTHLS